MDEAITFFFPLSTSPVPVTAPLSEAVSLPETMGEEEEEEEEDGAPESLFALVVVVVGVFLCLSDTFLFLRDVFL